MRGHGGLADRVTKTFLRVFIKQMTIIKCLLLKYLQLLTYDSPVNLVCPSLPTKGTSQRPSRYNEDSLNRLSDYTYCRRNYTEVYHY